jgi:hypothetical protein
VLIHVVEREHLVQMIASAEEIASQKERSGKQPKTEQLCCRIAVGFGVGKNLLANLLGLVQLRAHQMEAADTIKGGE